MSKAPRPSPSASAADHKDAVKKGNDGNRYVSVADKNGVYRWQKVKPKKAAKTGAKKGARKGAKTATKRAVTAATKKGARKAASPKRSTAAARKVPGKNELLALRAKREAALKKLIKENEFTASEKRILGAAWPCVVASYRVAGKAKIPVGSSRVGGLPDVPANFVWPGTTKPAKKPAKAGKKKKSTDSPLSFIAQINCADAAPFDIEGRLPATGLLSFFFDAVDLSGVTPRGVVFYTPASTPLSPAAAPPDLEAERLFVPLLLDKFRFGMTIPAPPDGAYESVLKGDDAELGDIYRSLAYDFDELNGDAPIQLFGYPDFVQYGETSAKNRLLLQVNPPGNYDAQVSKIGGLWPSYAFGDTGILYYEISEADLKARRFERASAQSQCS